MDAFLEQNYKMMETHPNLVNLIIENMRDRMDDGGLLEDEPSTNTSLDKFKNMSKEEALALLE